MTVPRSARPPREWLLLLIALVVVGLIVVPAWMFTHSADELTQARNRWDAVRVAHLLLGFPQIACYLCGAWAGLILIRRSMEVRRQRAAFGYELLPTDEGARILPEDARPLAIFRYDPLGAATLNPTFPFTGTVNVGNPSLKPYEARNYDLSLEWYLKGGGIVAVAAFRKDIGNPIYTYSETQRNVVYSGISLDALSFTSKQNATSGRISGLELNVYQPFTFLPAPFDGFGIDANYTRITSEEVVPTRPGEDIPFFRQPGKIANVTLFYEKAGFSARVAWSYADRQIYTIGSTVLNDIYRNPRGQYDVQLRYRISSRYSVTGSVRNVTREKEQFSHGVTGLLRTSRLLDRDYKLGVGVNF